MLHHSGFTSGPLPQEAPLWSALCRSTLDEVCGTAHSTPQCRSVLYCVVGILGLGDAQQGQQLPSSPLACPGAYRQRLRRHHAFQSTRGAKRSAISEDLIPATAPATKLHKDTSGDVRTAATVTAAVPTDATGTTLAAQSLVQLTQVEWRAALARLSVVAQLQSQLTEAQSQLKAAEATFGKHLRFEEQIQSSIARENAVKDSCLQRINALDSIVEALSQRIRARNVVVHGLPDTAAVSNPATLERLVKDRVDSVGPNRESSPVSQSITAVTRIGKPGAGNKAVLVEYSSSQAQKALDPDRIALRSKGYRTWFRHGTLWYLDQGVPRECKQGEAVRLPQPQGSPPRPNMPAAFVAGSDPVTAMDTGSAAPISPAVGSSSAAAPIPSCTPTATPPIRTAQFETWQYITKFHIVMLTETQSPALFGRQLSGYSVFTIPATWLGRASEGHLSPNSGLLSWESHHSVQLSQWSAQVRFESLAARIAQLSSEGHVLLAGDLNARVAVASQPWVIELSGGISAQLQSSGITVNGHGRRLVRLCEETAMVLCIGRTAGDTPAQPSFRARSNTEPSRLDH
ncbi:TPA: hypothetical protein ACH3X1_009233 [Trebouxia sp. C0004]